LKASDEVPLIFVDKDTARVEEGVVVHMGQLIIMRLPLRPVDLLSLDSSISLSRVFQVLVLQVIVMSMAMSVGKERW